MDANCFDGGGVGDGARCRLLPLAEPGVGTEVGCFRWQGLVSALDEVMLTRSCCPQPLLVSTRVTFNHFLCPDSTIWNSNRSDQAAFCGLIGPSTLSKPWFRAQLMSF